MITAGLGSDKAEKGVQQCPVLEHQDLMVLVSHRSPATAHAKSAGAHESGSTGSRHSNSISKVCSDPKDGVFYSVV